MKVSRNETRYTLESHPKKERANYDAFKVNVLWLIFKSFYITVEIKSHRKNKAIQRKRRPAVIWEQREAFGVPGCPSVGEHWAVSSPGSLKQQSEVPCTMSPRQSQLSSLLQFKEVDLGVELLISCLREQQLQGNHKKSVGWNIGPY